ncbi:MAG: flagellar hook-basal body complex protein FliE [Alphaproteobacteria bacterium]|nr:MAG: flagellar hook-basal body complex protein FliE [Alphaproteobacteria bacterium]
MNTNAIGQAASLYQNTAKIATGGISAGNEDKVSFASLIKDGVESVVDSQRQSESMSAAAVEGKADISQVVEAVTKAELELQTLVSVRDKVVSAYQDIMRMPI